MKMYRRIVFRLCIIHTLSLACHACGRRAASRLTLSLEGEGIISSSFFHDS